LEVYLQAIKDNEPGMIPPLAVDSAIGLFAESYGYAIFDPELGLVYKWDDPSMHITAWEQTPEYREAIDRLYSWSVKGYKKKELGFAQPDINTITGGSFGATIAAIDTEIFYNTLLEEKSVSGWKYKGYPLYPDKISQRNPSLDNAVVINSKSKNAQRVLMFLDWLQSKQENYDSLMYGIKGKHYTLKGDQYCLPQRVSTSENFTTWMGRQAFVNIDYERASNLDPADFYRKYSEHIMQTTGYAPHTGFTPVYDGINDIVANRRNTNFDVEISIYRNEFSSENIDNYIKEQQAKGIDSIITTVQQQIDKWRNAR
jgi:putative aldouronate transport system substrate-binding protein